ncbi:MAG: hypothetical protein SGJ15_02870 [Bacteroidota bacterium]|nr:hypothetical protein [Bacteroidota bacterium]
MSQSTSSGPGPFGHTGAVLANDWCDWNAASPIPFSLEHIGNQRMQFSTNGFMRMLLDNGNGAQAGGRVALGNNLIRFVPQDRLHLHHVTLNNINTYLRFTNSITGPTNLEGFAIGNSIRF